MLLRGGKNQKLASRRITFSSIVKTQFYLWLLPKQHPVNYPHVTQVCSLIYFMLFKEFYIVWQDPRVSERFITLPKEVSDNN